VRHSDGSLKQNGPIIRRKGDKYLVDCCVTGSTQGTIDDPKFALKDMFEFYVFPELLQFVGPGGEYEGYTVIIQGDNAGPHGESAYINFVTEYCASKGWHWEPQAPQMPHMNVLDLSVFPGMLRRHCNLARDRGGLNVLKEDEIWAAANDVWHELPSCKNASGFVQAPQIGQKVIDARGGNEFLGNKSFDKGIHCDVHKDFNQQPDYQGSFSACQTVT
jgi:hypothetical protein